MQEVKIGLTRTGNKNSGISGVCMYLLTEREKIVHECTDRKLPDKYKSVMNLKERKLE